MLWVVGKWWNHSCWIYYHRCTKWSCRAGCHNSYPNRLGVTNNGGIQPHYHGHIYGFQLLVSILRRPPYRYNRRWKYHTSTFIATAVKVAIVISQSVVVSIRNSCRSWCCWGTARGRMWQNHPNYMAHAHLSLSLRPLTACTWEPNNSGSLSGVLREPQIIHILQLIQDQHGVTTILQQLVQKNHISKCEDL
jgi:hypothetical protein